MPTLTCPDCRKSADYDGSTGTVECSYCGEDFVQESATDLVGATPKEINGLILTYQINSEKIRVPVSGETILGREGFGANVLSKISFNGSRVISRKHCSIQFHDGAFYIRDLGSVNGTFCGDSRASCEIARVIEDGSLIYLGEELFRARIDYGRRMETISNQVTKEIERPTVYRCNDPNCSPPYEADNIPKTKVCPRCGSFDKFVGAK
jgi:pSer/pThr/pTyr-binding forkhead associated (FHA) protein